MPIFPYYTAPSSIEYKFFDSSISPSFLKKPKRLKMLWLLSSVKSESLKTPRLELCYSRRKKLRLDFNELVCHFFVTIKARKFKRPFLFLSSFRKVVSDPRVCRVRHERVRRGTYAKDNANNSCLATDQTSEQTVACVPLFAEVTTTTTTRKRIRVRTRRRPRAREALMLNKYTAAK